MASLLWQQTLTGLSPTPRTWKVSHFSRIAMRLGELRATLWYTCGSSSSTSTYNGEGQGLGTACSLEE